MSSHSDAGAPSRRRASTVQLGECLKGFRVKLYPTQEQLQYLANAQAELLEMWNLLVTTWQTHGEYCIRYAEDQGAIAPLPQRPLSDRTTQSPEAIAEWEEYEKICRERRRVAMRHCRTIKGLTRRDWANRAADYHGVKLTENARQQQQLDYRVLRTAVPGSTTAHMVQALIESYQSGLKSGRRPPKSKKRARDMPLLLRSGKGALQLGEYHTRKTASGSERITGSHRCFVKFGSQKIKARLHRLPPGPFLEGVALVLEQDGWYAAAKVRAAPQQPPLPTKAIIAINPGLECLYADNEGFVVENPRGNAYSLRIREFSDWIAEADEHWDEVYRRNQQGRYQERFARRTADIIYGQIVPRLADYATILIGKTSKTVAQGRQTRISRNDEGGYVSAMGLMQQAIVQRYGIYDAEVNPTGRVRLVETVGISRRCSRCGNEHPKRYQRNNSRLHDQVTDCHEPSCLLKIHVDVNAARNLLANHLNLPEVSAITSWNGCVEPTRPRPDLETDNAPHGA